MPSPGQPSRAGLNALLTVAVLGLITWALQAIPAPGLEWVVPVGLPHQGGYPEGTPGLRPVNLAEGAWLEGSGLLWSLAAGFGLVALLRGTFTRQAPGGRATVAVAGTAAVFLFTLAWCDAPVGQHRCSGPETGCRSNLKTLGMALDIAAEEHHGVYPRALAELTPSYLLSLPTCPLTGTGYRLESSGTAYTVICGPHPIYYGGNDMTASGKCYLHRQVPEYSFQVYGSQAGLGGR